MLKHLMISWGSQEQNIHQDCIPGALQSMEVHLLRGISETGRMRFRENQRKAENFALWTSLYSHSRLVQVFQSPEGSRRHPQVLHHQLRLVLLDRFQVSLCYCFQVPLDWKAVEKFLVLVVHCCWMLVVVDQVQCSVHTCHLV